jgi:hypothetical protein
MTEARSLRFPYTPVAVVTDLQNPFESISSDFSFSGGPRRIERSAVPSRSLLVFSTGQATRGGPRVRVRVRLEKLCRPVDTRRGPVAEYIEFSARDWVHEQ